MSESHDEAVRRLRARAERRERQLKAAVTVHDCTPEQVAELRARLARLEAERRAEDEWEPLTTLVRESLEGDRDVVK
jgi:hypothetical protein